MGAIKRHMWAAVAVMAVAVGASFAPSAELAAADNDPPAFHGYQRSFPILRPAEPTSAAPIHTPRGGVTTLKRFSGKVVLLNIWATWCPACLYELPTLSKLQAEIGGNRFTVVSLSIDEGGARAVSPYLRRLGLTNLPTYLDPAGRIIDALRVDKALPHSLIIDHRGRVMDYMKGAADWTSAEARALIDYYVGHISP